MGWPYAHLLGFTIITDAFYTATGSFHSRRKQGNLRSDRQLLLSVDDSFRSDG